MSEKNNVVNDSSPADTSSIPYVLHNPKGRQMTEQGWKRLWESYMRDLNVKYGYDGQQNKNRPGGLPMLIDTFTPHQLRHTFCTLMYFAGVDVMTRPRSDGPQGHLGHAGHLHRPR